MAEKSIIQLFVRLVKKEQQEYQDTGGKCNSLFERIIMRMRKGGRL